jgi:hypothetical protein
MSPANEQSTHVSQTGQAADAAAAELELEQKNLVWGLALFGVFLLLLGATVLVAFIYLAVA